MVGWDSTTNLFICGPSIHGKKKTKASLDGPLQP